MQQEDKIKEQMIDDAIKYAIKLRDKEWVEEIEECQIKPNCFSRDLYTEGTVIMGKNQWQSLKSKMGVEVELA